MKQFPFAISIRGDVPVRRGLGGSATVRVGILHGLNALAGSRLSREQLFELTANLEGHPDNAAPAEFGGFNVVGIGAPQRLKFRLELQFALLIPDLEVATKDARRVLPSRFLVSTQSNPPAAHLLSPLRLFRVISETARRICGLSPPAVSKKIGAVSRSRDSRGRTGRALSAVS